MCSVLVFGTFVPFALFSVCFVRFFTYVSVLRTVLKVFSMIVWYVSVSSTVLNVLCTIFCYVSVFCTVLNVLCWIVCLVSSSRTVFHVFCWIVCHVSALRAFLYVFCIIVWYVSTSRIILNVYGKIFLPTLVFCAPFWKWSVWLFGRLVLCALFWMCCVRFFVTLVSCALFWMCCAGLFVLFVLRELFCMCFLYYLLRSSSVHCLLLLCPAELNESNLYNTIRFSQTRRFFSTTGAHGMRAHNSNKTADHHVRHSNCEFNCVFVTRVSHTVW